MDDDLICNLRTCRKRLNSSFAWVTSCSHIFCDADGAREFTKSLICPACDTSLPNKYDIVRLDLKPSEQFKAIAWCGLRPETVLEMCTRAIAFWNYQCHQERTYQEHMASKARDKNAQLEQYYEQVVNRLQTELNTIKNRIASTKKKLEEYETKCRELKCNLTEKTRQHSKLQALYEALRRRCVTPATFSDSNGPTDIRDIHAQSFMMNLSSRDDILGPPGSTGRNHPSVTGGLDVIRRSPPEREFTLKPNHTPQAGDAGNLPRFSMDPRMM
ncbi:E3 ubiquitin-protein ligase CCNB1IP1-like isoform X2 [Littorina saxatilis]|uniref:RING-type domain-containing protein n=2 Tax=Littorina saxatilis TaxID=31220 RepID=A0AAN9C2K8_9CAEN